MITYRECKATKKQTEKKGKAKYFYSDTEECFAEELAIKEYENEGYKAIWTENHFWWTILTLLFWDVIFAKIEGVWHPQFGDFPNEYQDMPNDLFTTEFYLRRQDLVKNRTRELSASDVVEKVRESYKQNYGRNCRLVENWDKFSFEQLTEPIRYVGSYDLLEILQRLLLNFNDNRAGLPDLTVYSEDGLYFVEVKTEKDRISEKQREWHSFLSDELNLKVELFLINHSDKQVKNVRDSYEGK